MMAPEVLFNSDWSSDSSKSDCWSLGMILYQLLTGLHPNSDVAQDLWKPISDLSIIGKMAGMAPIYSIYSFYRMKNNVYIVYTLDNCHNFS